MTPRTIEECYYDVDYIVSITHKQEQPSILEHHLIRGKH